MKKLDYLSEIKTAHRMKAHEKAAEASFSSFEDENFEDYDGDDYDGEENFEDFSSKKSRVANGVGKIKLNTLKVSLISDGTVAVAGVVVPLFGAFVNMYAALNNIPTGVTATGSPTAYAQILATSLAKPWSIRGLKVIVGGASPASQLNQSFTVTETDLTGKSTTEPYFPSDSFSARQQQNGIIEMPNFAIDVDGNTQLNYRMLPSQSVDLLFYVSAQVDISRITAGKNALGVSARSFPTNKEEIIVRNR